MAETFRIQTILVPVDFSDVTPKLVETAAGFAKAFGSRVVLLHIAAPEPDFVGFEPGPMTVRVSVARDVHEDHRRLDVVKHQLAESNIEAAALHIQGPTVLKILNEKDEQGADLLLMGSPGQGEL